MSKRKDRGHRGTPNALRASKPVRTAAPLRAGNSTEDEAGSFRSSLARLLDAPHFARLVPHLAPETLHQLIRRSGLDACGELVASTTPEQLTSVLDLDLWRHAQPGRDEQFDADRFKNASRDRKDLLGPGIIRSETDERAAEKQREIASKGGKASGGNFANDPERASEAGRKGGRARQGGRSLPE